MIRQLSVRELHERLANGERPLIVEAAGAPSVARGPRLDPVGDVREGWELNICRLPDTLHIPMREIPARAAELPRDTEIVIMCHHGVRSQQVALYLKQLGYAQLSNLAGGIAAWARDVDPATPTY
jgi:rhodanese-related sulfurtransferase